MNYNELKAIIQNTKRNSNSPVLLGVVGNFEAFIDLKYQTEGQEHDYELKLEEAMLRFIHSAKAAAKSFGISQETLHSEIEERLKNYRELSSEHKSLKHKTTKA